MEIQLRELIDQIKKDGVDAAESEAAKIIEAAHAEAEGIINSANAEADRIVSSAKAENDRLVRVSEDAIRQAGRNLLLSFRESVAREVEAIAGERVPYAYSHDAMSEVILKAVEEWTKNPEAEDITVLLNPEDLQVIENTLLAALKDRLLGGITLKPCSDFDGGFRISVNNGSAYFDYSAEIVVDMMSAYLNPRITALLKEAEGV